MARWRLYTQIIRRILFLRFRAEGLLELRLPDMRLHVAGFVVGSAVDSIHVVAHCAQGACTRGRGHTYADVTVVTGDSVTMATVDGGVGEPVAVSS